MERVDYLGGLRRRWLIIVIATVLGMIGAWLTRSVGPAAAERFEAGSPVLGSTDPTVTNLATLSVLTTLGDVPRRVAESLGYDGDPSNLADHITASPDQGTGILWIVATGASPQQTERLANAFAEQLVASVERERLASATAEAARVQEEMDGLEKEIAKLENRLAGANGTEASLLTAELNAAMEKFGVLSQQDSPADAAAADSPSLRILERASAGPVSAELLGPLSPAARLAIGGALGLLAGLALALILERSDRRIRTRAGAERSFRLPVLAEIPSPSRLDRRAIVDADGRVSPSLQPYRLLAALTTSGAGSNGAPTGNGRPAAPGQLVLVTSPGSAEDKARVVGSLAATYAETGKKVLLVSCDLRRPLVGKLLRVPDGPGLSDALTSGNGRGLLQPYAQSTPLANLKVIPSGEPTENPSRLISSARMLRVLQEARESADIVLVDAPLLSNGEAAYLIADVRCGAPRRARGKDDHR